MTYGDLADRILAVRNKEAGKNPKTPYYFLNISHPALRGLYASWKHSISPPDDRDRMIWELKQLSAEALRGIVENLNNQEA